jgi:hypothetical protein
MEISHPIWIEIFESQQNMGINYYLKRIPTTFKWVFKIKTKLDGIIDNFITRLVAKKVFTNTWCWLYKKQFPCNQSKFNQSVVHPYYPIWLRNA